MRLRRQTVESSLWNRDAISDARGGTDVTAAVANRVGVAAVIYSPEVIEIMSAALHAAIESLPEPVSATQVHALAESILNTASRGERDVRVLVRIALVTAFRSSCSLAAPTFHELRKGTVTSKFINPVPLSI